MRSSQKVVLDEERCWNLAIQDKDRSRLAFVGFLNLVQAACEAELFARLDHGAIFARLACLTEFVTSAAADGGSSFICPLDSQRSLNEIALRKACFHSA